MLDKKLSTKEKEEVFQKAYDENDDLTMWECVIDCCKNIMLSKCKGIVVRDLEDKILDAACNVMEKIKEGKRPKKLSSFCYLYAIGVLWNKKNIIWDRSVDFSSFDNVYFTENDGNFCSGEY